MLELLLSAQAQTLNVIGSCPSNDAGIEGLGHSPVPAVRALFTQQAQHEVNAMPI